MLSSTRPLAFHKCAVCTNRLVLVSYPGFSSMFSFLPLHLCFTSWNGKSDSSQVGSLRQIWRRRKWLTWSGKTQCVFHSIRRSKLLIFTTRKGVIRVILQNAIVYCMHMYVYFLCSRVMSVFLVFGFFCSGVFLTPRIVAVALAVRNRTSTTNSLDLLLGIKRTEEQTDEVPGLFSNNECRLLVSKSQPHLPWCTVLNINQLLVTN